MTLQEIQDRMEIRELTDVFANLADTKEVEKQVEFFLPDGRTAGRLCCMASFI